MVCFVRNIELICRVWFCHTIYWNSLPSAIWCVRLFMCLSRTRSHVFTLAFTSKKFSICPFALCCARHIYRRWICRSNQRTQFHGTQCKAHTAEPSRAENVKLCAGLLILSQFGCSCCRCLRRPFILLQNCKSKLHLLVKRQNIDCVYTNLIRFHQSFRVCYLFRWFAVWILSKFSFHFEMVCAVCSSRFSNRTWFFGGFVLKMPTFTRIYIYLQLCSVQHMLLSFSGGETVSAFSFILCITNFIHFVCILDTCRNEGMQLIRWNLNRNGIEPFVCS